MRTQLFIHYFLFGCFTLIMIVFCIFPFSHTLSYVITKEQSHIAFSDIMKGTLYLLDREFATIPEQNRTRHIHRLQQRFGFPLDIRQEKELNLSPDEKEFACRGGIVIRQKGTIFLRKIDQENNYVSLGPVADQKSIWGIAHYITYGAVVCFLLLFSLLWAIGMEKRRSTEQQDHAMRRTRHLPFSRTVNFSRMQERK